MSRPPETTRATEEFASERYFTKLHQQAENSSSRENVAEVAAPLPPPSEFILPIVGGPSLSSSSSPGQEQPAQEVKSKEKRGLFRRVFSSKSASPPAEQDVAKAQVVEAAPKRSRSFDELFASLPNELQIQIIASLPLRDVLNMRLASKTMHALVTFNEGPIVRHHLDHHVPAYAKRLYPVTEPSKIDLHHLCGIWHRLHVAAKLSYLMCEWITKEIFLRTTEAQRAEFAPQRERMRRRLIPLVFTVFHFFETYRDLHLKYLDSHQGIGLLREPYTVNPIEQQILAMYDDRTLLRVHQVFPLIVSSFCRRLRPPSYVGRVERAMRGYIRDKPADEVHVAILCLGGLRQVEEFWLIKGYNLRRARVDSWYNSLTQEPPKPAAPKQRRGLMGALGRKKSLAALKEGAAAAAAAASADDNANNAPPVPPLPNNYANGTTTNGNVNNNNITAAAASASASASAAAAAANSNNNINTINPLLTSSLSAGMPMGRLSHEQARQLLRDLPVLQQIWLTTAEALILERKIVERPGEIKRNAHVMLDLIREDGAAEEDEWLYGNGAPESITPHLEAIEEDDDEDQIRAAI